MRFHIPSSNALVDPSHCLTTLTPSSVIIFGYLLRNATPSNWMTFFKQMITDHLFNYDAIRYQKLLFIHWTKQNVKGPFFVSQVRSSRTWTAAVWAGGRCLCWTWCPLDPCNVGETIFFPCYTIIIKPWCHHIWAPAGRRTSWWWSHPWFSWSEGLDPDIWGGKAKPTWYVAN